MGIHFYAILFNQLFNCSISDEVSESLLNALHSANSMFPSKWENSKSFPSLPRNRFVANASVASSWFVLVMRNKFISFSNKVFMTEELFAIVWSCLLHSTRTGFLCIALSDNKVYKNLKIKPPYRFCFRMGRPGVSIYLLRHISNIFLKGHWIDHIDESFRGQFELIKKFVPQTLVSRYINDFQRVLNIWTSLKICVLKTHSSIKYSYKHLHY